MHKYSVEVSHYIITYHKNTKKNPDTDEIEIERKQSYTPLTNLDWVKGFDNFIEETRWIDSEIVDILDKVWKSLPGKHVYLSKSVPTTTLDIKLSIYGFPKTIYRIVYKHHRNELSDYLRIMQKRLGLMTMKKSENIEGKKLEALSDELTDIGKEFKKEIDSLKNDGLISLEESRWILVHFASISSSIRCLIHSNDYECAWDKITKTYQKIKNNIKDIEPCNVYVSSNYISHSNAVVEITNKMHTLIWEIDNLKHPENWPRFSSIAFMAVDYISDYTFHIVNQHLSEDRCKRSYTMSTDTDELLERAEEGYRDSIKFYRDALIKSLTNLDTSAETVNVDTITEDWNSFVDSLRYLEAVQMLKDEDSFVDSLRYLEAVQILQDETFVKEL